MSRLRALVSGSAGQLAQAIRHTWLGHDLILPEESQFDLSDPHAVRSMVSSLRPDVVINAGAFTLVDRCEAEVARAMRINGEAVGWLAEACEAAQCLLIQISTDYVFDGRASRPYRETDTPNPQSVYGRSKLLGEQEAQRASQHLVVRTSWLYDAWGKNFYLTMRHAAEQGRVLRVVNDQVGAPTTCRALARQIRIAAEEGWRGLVHATCQGQTSWHGFAAEIFRQTGTLADLSPCETRDYPLPALRPAYSVLDGSSRARLGSDLMPPWQEALAEVITHPDLT